MSRIDVDRQIEDLAAKQASAFSLEQVKTCGGDRYLASRRVRAQRWDRLATTVFRLRWGPITWFTQLWGALLEAGPGAVASHRSAARLHGLWAFRNTIDVEVIRTEPHDHDITLGTLHRTSILDPHHVTTIDGAPTTSLARTMFDLAAAPPRHVRRSQRGRDIYAAKLRKIYNDAFKHHGLRADQVARVLVELGKRGRPGTVFTRELLASFGPGYVPTESELEELFLAVLRAYDIEEPERQRRIGDDEEFIGRVDFVYLQAKLIIEIDGRDHDGPLDRDSDSWRDIALQAQGWRVYRFSWRQLMFEPEKVAAAIRRALAGAAA